MEWKLERYSRFRVKTGEAILWANIMSTLSKDFVVTKKHCPVRNNTRKRPRDASNITYSRFKSRIAKRLGEADDLPLASSPVTTRWQHSCAAEYDSVCQRLCYDPPLGGASLSQLETATHLQDADQAVEAEARGLDCGVVLTHGASRKSYPGGCGDRTVGEQGCVWQDEGLGEARCCTRQPFALLERFPSMPCSCPEPELRMDIPGLQDDYYLNLLAWSEKNLVALALGSAVFVWNAETQVLQGSLRVRPHSCSVGSTAPSSYSPISSVSWNRDGHTLAVGTGDGEVQLWDMERRCSVRNISGHLSSVGCLSWNQQILSSGSILGLVCHHDVRAAQRAVGWLRQRKGVCGLEWSPTGERLATGSSDGLLSVWTGDPGTRGGGLPLLSLPHPTAVKALGWCPWQPELVAVGGGKGDGVLRIWDTRTGACRQAAQTNSQICCLSWSPKRAELFTGHGLPYNQIVPWNFPTLTKGAELHGHQGRVLQLASSPCGNRVLSTGSDHLAFMWRAVDRHSELQEET